MTLATIEFYILTGLQQPRKVEDITKRLNNLGLRMTVTKTASRLRTMAKKGIIKSYRLDNGRKGLYHKTSTKGRYRYQCETERLKKSMARIE